MGSVVSMRRFNCCPECGILVPNPGIKLMSPALQGRFLTTGPPGESLIYSVFIQQMRIIHNYLRSTTGCWGKKVRNKRLKASHSLYSSGRRFRKFKKYVTRQQLNIPHAYHAVTPQCLCTWCPCNFSLPAETLPNLKGQYQCPPFLAQQLCLTNIISFLSTCHTLPSVIGCCLVTQSCLTLVSPRTAALQAPLSMRFPRQEYWSGLPFPFPRGLPNVEIKPHLLHWQADSLPLSHPRSPLSFRAIHLNYFISSLRKQFT